MDYMVLSTLISIAQLSGEYVHQQTTPAEELIIEECMERIRYVPNKPMAREACEADLNKQKGAAHE